MGKPFWWKRGAQLLQRKVAGWTLGGLKVSEGLDDKVWVPQNFHETLIWLVVEPPLWKMMEFVSWDDDIPNIYIYICIYMEK